MTNDLLNLLDECQLCPRNCQAKRNAEGLGNCAMSAEVRVARAALHHWEEPCLSGERGSGAVFFSGCSLGCVYCQNQDISHGKSGKAVTIERLAEIFGELQAQRAHNLNLVTGDHFLPQIITALSLAKEKGFNLPVVYNCSGYQSQESLRRLDGWVDIYLVDCKYFSVELAARYSHAPDYPQIAKTALAEMVRQQPRCIFDENGIMRRGVIVRYLLLPGALADGKEIVSFLHQRYGDQIYLSLMSQYTPVGDLRAYPELQRTVTDEEYNALVDYAVNLGVEQAFIQEGDAAQESFIPPFDYQGV